MGVGILLNLLLQFKTSNFDIFGRYVVLDIAINRIDYRMINVYCPNIAGKKRIYF